MSADHSIGAFYRDRHGSTAVEFAIVGPMVIILLIAILAFGWAINGMMTVRYALEEAGRILQMNPTLSESEFDTIVKDRLIELGAPDVKVSLVVDEPVGLKKLAHATASYDFSISVPFLEPYTYSYQTTLTVPLPVSLIDSS